MQNSRYTLAVEGVGSLENFDGDKIAEVLGIDMGNLERDVAVVIGYVGGLFALLLLTPPFKALMRLMYTAARDHKARTWDRARTR